MKCCYPGRENSDRDTKPSLTTLPVVLQPGCSEVYAVDFGEDSAHGSVGSPPLAGQQRWQGGVAVDVAGAVLHQVERCPKGAGEAKGNWCG